MSPSPTAHRVLVIDDNVDAATTITMLLRMKGYDVHTAHGGREGLQIAEQARPTLVLCDIGMPELDGYQTARLFRKQPWGEHVTLVALTGYGQQEDIQRSADAGFDQHLVKPVDPALLIQLLSQWPIDRR